MSKLLSEIASLLADHKIVPFIGAGCSKEHLKIDWDWLLDDMAKISGSSSKNHPEVADDYVSVFGREAFFKYLEKHLIIDEFEDCKGETLLALLGLNLGIYYTTNQDNVFEKCCKKYQREFNFIKDINDIATIDPSLPILYKFHGDLKKPDTIVFSKTDYDGRMKEENHPLNIRLKSDCLSKSLLFIGYSFRDPNIISLFEQLKYVFGDRLPRSYLIQYSPDHDFEKRISSDFDVTPINCLRELPDMSNKDKAFNAFMVALLDKVYSLMTAQSIKMLFTPNRRYATKIVSCLEIDAVNNAASSGSFDNSINAFRSTFDASLIPKDYENGVRDIFVMLARAVETESQYNELCSALFHLRVQNPLYAVTCSGACFAAANVIQSSGPIGMRPPVMKQIPSELNILAAAIGIELLRDWSRAISKGFYDFISYNRLRFVPPDKFPSDVRDYILEQFSYAYSKPKIQHNNPLLRLKTNRDFQSGTFHDWQTRLFSLWPKGRRFPPND